MLIVYTGNGKGKTSACVGQTIRALGSGLRVAFGQFMKENTQAGEQKMLRQLLGDDFFPSGLGFLFNKDDEEKNKRHGQAAQKLFAWGYAKLEEKDMVVFDECLYALGMDVITQKDVEDFLDVAKKKGVHIVLSGRGLPPWLKERADLVSEICEVKHPYNVGIGAEKGIEF